LLHCQAAPSGKQRIFCAEMKKARQNAEPLDSEGRTNCLLSKLFRSRIHGLSHSLENQTEAMRRLLSQLHCVASSFTKKSQDAGSIVQQVGGMLFIRNQAAHLAPPFFHRRTAA
jgi:hypothetical protein